MGVIKISQTIETRRLLLRAPRLADAARIAELANDWEVVKNTGRMPFPYAQSDALDWIGRAAAADPRVEATFVIEHEDHGPMGSIGCFRGEEPLWEVGYWLGRPFWGRGYASEALAATVDWACRRRGRRAVVAGHMVENRVSGVVLEKAGFLYTGVVKSLYSRARDAEVPTRRMIRLA